MKMTAFKQILLKKSVGNHALTRLVLLLDNDDLVRFVDEALEKAEPGGNAGRNLNLILNHFAKETADRPDMQSIIRDALGHHISAHKAEFAAHKAAQSARDFSSMRNHRSAADAHLNKIMNLMYFCTKMHGKNSNNNITMKYSDPRPWEHNYVGLDTRVSNDGSIKVQENSEGWRRKARPSASREKNSLAVPDYRYFEMPPHPHSDVEHGDDISSGYPFEKIRVGTESELAAGGGYLPIRDIEATGKFKPHFFDSHPVLNYVRDTNKEAEHYYQNYLEAEKNWITRHLGERPDGTTYWHDEYLNNLYAQHPHLAPVIDARGKEIVPSKVEQNHEQSEHHFGTLFQSKKDDEETVSGSQQGVHWQKGQTTGSRKEGKHHIPINQGESAVDLNAPIDPNNIPEHLRHLIPKHNIKTSQSPIDVQSTSEAEDEPLFDLDAATYEPSVSQEEVQDEPAAEQPAAEQPAAEQPQTSSQGTGGDFLSRLRAKYSIKG